MGGYVAGPPVLAALLRGVPVVVMEPNAVPGVTNRWIARWVKRALINFEETARFFPAGPHRSDRASGARRVFPAPAQAAERVYRADHRRQPGLANSEQCGAAKLATVPRIRTAGAIHPPDRTRNV